MLRFRGFIVLVNIHKIDRRDITKTLKQMTEHLMTQIVLNYRLCKTQRSIEGKGERKIISTRTPKVRDI